jgi:energy-coupling factor transporter ATP-binding protein EcfA2
MCVLAGKNDCGKSNILKALNLFFNNETDWRMPLDFGKDFSYRRRDEVRKTTVKGRQFIRVKLFLLRGPKAQKSLPERFTATRTWYRDSPIPETKYSIEAQFNSGQIKTKSLDRALANAARYVGRIRFEYVPAVKDRAFFGYSLGLLQDTILHKKIGRSSVANAVGSLNASVEKAASILNDEFARVCSVKTHVRLPEDLAALFRAFAVATESGDEELPLAMRGDGIQGRFLPSLLHYVAANSTITYIWGFEEPENCMEYPLAVELAKEIRNNYSRPSQILITSHSPAFYGLQQDGVAVYRVYTESGSTSATPVWPVSQEDAGNSVVANELGLMQLTVEQHHEYQKRLAEQNELAAKVTQLESTLARAKRPILLTEGPTDKLILEEAWRRLNPNRAPIFDVESCETTPGSGGADVLLSTLNSHRASERPVVGLFDRDDKGLRCFDDLCRSFRPHANDASVKLHVNAKAAAFLIPEIAGKEQYVAARNLSLEFLFPEKAIVKKTNQGRGLLLEQRKAITKTSAGVRIGEMTTTEPQHRQILDGKMDFAREIVPTLDDADFDNFKPVFEKLADVLGRAQA